MVSLPHINLLNIQNVHEHEIAYTHARGQSHRATAKARALISISIVGLFNLICTTAYRTYALAALTESRFPFKRSQYICREKKIVYQIIIRIITIFFLSCSRSLRHFFFLFKFHYSRRTFLTHLFSISSVVGCECVYGRLFVCFFVIVSWLRRISGIQFHILFSLYYFIASSAYTLYIVHYCDQTHTRNIGENVHFCFFF